MYKTTQYAPTGDVERVANSAFRIPDPTRSTNPTKTGPTVNKLTFTTFSLFWVWSKPQPHGKQ